MVVVPILGVLAGVASVVNTVPYIRDVLRGTTRPHRGTWVIWAVMAFVVYASQRADGASWSLIMAGAQAVFTAFVFLLAIRLGEGGLCVGDASIVALAGAGVAGWIVADEPLVATVCIIAADLVAAGLMVPKTYRDPGSETFASFAVASVGGALAAGAVGGGEPSLLLYPIYFCAVNAAIAVLIVRRRARLAGV